MAKKKLLGTNDVLKQIEKDEREAFVKFEQEQREKREKVLADALEPLVAKRDELHAAMKAIARELVALDREISRLVDGPLKAASKSSETSGKRKRRSEDDLKADAQKIYDFIKGKGKAGASARELNGLGVKKVPSWADFVKSKIGKTIKTEGPEKRPTYFAE